MAHSDSCNGGRLEWFSTGPVHREGSKLKRDVTSVPGARVISGRFFYLFIIIIIIIIFWIDHRSLQQSSYNPQTDQHSLMQLMLLHLWIVTNISHTSHPLVL